MHANTASPRPIAGGCRGKVRMSGASTRGPSRKIEARPYATLPVACTACAASPRLICRPEAMNMATMTAVCSCVRAAAAPSSGCQMPSAMDEASARGRKLPVIKVTARRGQAEDESWEDIWLFRWMESSDGCPLGSGLEGLMDLHGTRGQGSDGLTRCLCHAGGAATRHCFAWRFSKDIKSGPSQ